MRFWKGKKRLAKKINSRYFTDRQYRETADYLLNCSVGDIIGSCSGYNIRIDEIEYLWCVTKSTKILEDIEIVSNGAIHRLGCLYPPKTKEEVLEYIKSYSRSKNFLTEWKLTNIIEDLEKINNGEDPLDENGVRNGVKKTVS